MGLANKLTVFRLALIPLYVVFMLIETTWALYVAIGIFFIAAMTDLFDGHVARKREQVSDFGKLIDPIADKLLVASALILLLSRGWLDPIYVLIVICREFLISGVRLISLSKEGKIISAAWLGKIKTVTQIVAIIWIMVDVNNHILPWFGLPYAQIVVYISLFFTLWSMLDYIIKNRKLLSFI